MYKRRNWTELIHLCLSASSGNQLRSTATLTWHTFIYMQHDHSGLCGFYCCRAHCCLYSILTGPLPPSPSPVFQDNFTWMEKKTKHKKLWTSFVNTVNDHVVRVAFYFFSTSSSLSWCTLSFDHFLWNLNCNFLTCCFSCVSFNALCDAVRTCNCFNFL